MHVGVVIRSVVDCRVLLPADSYLEKPLVQGQVRIINPSDWSALEQVGGRGAKIAAIQISPYKPPLTKPQTPDFQAPAEQRLRAIIAGGVVRKQGEVVTGQPEEMVEKLSEFLCLKQ